MAEQIQLRRDYAARWTIINPILAQGEYGYELDTGSSEYRPRKLGDGVTPWNELPYEAFSAHTHIIDGGNV